MVWLSSFSLCVLAIELPPEVPINGDVLNGTGRIFLSLRLADGTRVEAIADSGCDSTVLDVSLVPILGRKLGNKRLLFPAIGWADADIYDHPVLLLGGTRLMADGKARVTPFRERESKASDVRAIIGLNCLKHYCVQIDPIAGKVRFLDSQKLEKNALGEGIKLRLDWIEEKAYLKETLTGNTRDEAILDTGCPPDGGLDWRTFRRLVRDGQATVFFKGRAATLGSLSRAVVREVGFHGNTYTNVTVVEMGAGNLIGLRFLARHLATIDFPGRMLYLKRIDDSAVVGKTPTTPSDNKSWNDP